jgi:hypothetical protein
MKTIQDAVREFKLMRDAADELKEKLSRLQSKIDIARQQDLPQMFKDSGVTSIAVDGYRFVISHTVRASIPADTKPAAYEWLRNNDKEELIFETVNASTLAAEAKKMMEEGLELPQDLFKVAVVPNVSVTKV